MHSSSHLGAELDKLKHVQVGVQKMLRWKDDDADHFTKASSKLRRNTICKIKVGTFQELEAFKLTKSASKYMHTNKDIDDSKSNKRKRLIVFRHTCENDAPAIKKLIPYK